MRRAWRSRCRRASYRCARDWLKLGFELDLGIGIAQGFATLGAFGFEGRWDYSAIGSVVNLAARLCDEAKGGQILIDRRTRAALGDGAEVDADRRAVAQGLHAAGRRVRAEVRSRPSRIAPARERTRLDRAKRSYGGQTFGFEPIVERASVVASGLMWGAARRR